MTETPTEEYKLSYSETISYFRKVAKGEIMATALEVQKHYLAHIEDAKEEASARYLTEEKDKAMQAVVMRRLPLLSGELFVLAEQEQPNITPERLAEIGNELNLLARTDLVVGAITKAIQTIIDKLPKSTQ